MVISISKAKIPVGDSKAFDAISGGDIDLHAVISDKKVTAAAHDGVVGIVEKVIYIKEKDVSLREVIMKKTTSQIDGGIDVDIIIFEICQTDPFAESQGRWGIILRCAESFVL